MGQTKRPSLETAFSKRYHLRLPLLARPSGDAASVEEVAALCNGGLFGVFSVRKGSQSEIAAAIQSLHKLTTRPFAVSLSGDDSFEVVLRTAPALVIFDSVKVTAAHGEACRGRGIRSVGIVRSSAELNSVESSGVDSILVRASAGVANDILRVSKRSLILNLKAPSGADLALWIQSGFDAVETAIDLAGASVLEASALASLKV